MKRMIAAIGLTWTLLLPSGASASPPIDGWGPYRLGVTTAEHAKAVPGIEWKEEKLPFDDVVLTSMKAVKFGILSYPLHLRFSSRHKLWQIEFRALVTADAEVPCESAFLAALKEAERLHGPLAPIDKNVGTRRTFLFGGGVEKVSIMRDRYVASPYSRTESKMDDGSHGISFGADLWGSSLNRVAVHGHWTTRSKRCEISVTYALRAATGGGLVPAEEEEE